jgi:hypothetical protein
VCVELILIISFLFSFSLILEDQVIMVRVLD